MMNIIYMHRMNIIYMHRVSLGWCVMQGEVGQQGSSSQPPSPSEYRVSQRGRYRPTLAYFLDKKVHMLIIELPPHHHPPPPPPPPPCQSMYYTHVYTYIHVLYTCIHVYTCTMLHVRTCIYMYYTHKTPRPLGALIKVVGGGGVGKVTFERVAVTSGIFHN